MTTLGKLTTSICLLLPSRSRTNSLSSTWPMVAGSRRRCGGTPACFAATPAQRRNWEILPFGDAVGWDEIDEYISAKGAHHRRRGARRRTARTKLPNSPRFLRAREILGPDMR